jgi:hypothetical protein
MRRRLLFALCIAVVGCEAPPGPPQARQPDKPGPQTTPQQAQAEPAAQPATPAVARVDPETRYGPADRVVAIADVHGDLDAAKRALRLAGAIDENDQWVGKDLVLVQTGDQLDRGDDEQAILELLEELEKQAAAAGGAVHLLNGNHEVMNTQLDLRYVTPGGYADFDDAPGLDLSAAELQEVPADARARVAAFRPGGPYAKRFGNRNAVVIVGDSVFVHGGVLPEHVDYGLDKLNQEMRDWFRGERADPPPGVAGERGVTWVRDYSAGPVDEATCKRLAQTLGKIGAARMVVGHTVQQGGITSACDGKVWRIDVGMAEHYGGRPAALEIKAGEVRALTE